MRQGVKFQVQNPDFMKSYKHSPRLLNLIATCCLLASLSRLGVRASTCIFSWRFALCTECFRDLDKSDLKRLLLDACGLPFELAKTLEAPPAMLGEDGEHSFSVDCVTAREAHFVGRSLMEGSYSISLGRVSKTLRFE